jgi:hypothetical protein
MPNAYDIAIQHSLPCGTTKAQANGKLSELTLFYKGSNAKWPPLYKEVLDRAKASFLRCIKKPQHETQRFQSTTQSSVK